MSPPKRPRTRTPVDPQPAGPPGEEALRRRVADRAYDLFLKRGCEHGHDVADWLEAERQVSSELGQPSRALRGTLPRSPLRAVTVRRLVPDA